MEVAGGHAVAVVGRGRDIPSLSTPAIEKMTFTAQESVSVSLIQDRGSLHQTQGEESSVMCAQSEWDVFCRGYLLKAGIKIKTYFVLNEK